MTFGGHLKSRKWTSPIAGKPSLRAYMGAYSDKYILHARVAQNAVWPLTLSDLEEGTTTVVARSAETVRDRPIG
jgi:hypothetical protein